jgi:hypothetical protein
MGGKNKYCEKVISKSGLRGPRGLQGPIGPPGQDGVSIPGSIVFEPIPEFTITSTPILIEAPVVLDGDYLVELEAWVSLPDPFQNLTSQLAKSTVYQGANVNAGHRNNSSDGGQELTYTHKAKVAGCVAGDTLGFRIFSSSNLTLLNGSLTLTKIP